MLRLTSRLARGARDCAGRRRDCRRSTALKDSNFWPGGRTCKKSWRWFKIALTARAATPDWRGRHQEMRKAISDQARQIPTTELRTATESVQPQIRGSVRHECTVSVPPFCRASLARGFARRFAGLEALRRTAVRPRARFACRRRLERVAPRIARSEAPSIGVTPALPTVDKSL